MERLSSTDGVGKTRPSLIVGIGASAGGIEAMKEFFLHVPPQSGAAYVVILHLSPDYDSRLAEVLQTTAKVPVTQVVERTPLESDHVYVISPSRVLRIEGDHIAVDEMQTMEERRAPVDMFFRSLADTQGNRCVCIVLSGTGPNGSSGLKRVKEHGGLTMAQDPAEAKYEDMPRNSIATGHVDLVLPVREMPTRLVRYAAQVRQQPPELPVRAASPEGDTLRDVLAILRVRTGHDFSNYKLGTIQRRVERRVTILGLPSLDAYARHLRLHADEAAALMRDLLISVTNFFRDRTAFEALSRYVLPQLFVRRGDGEQIRLWVPGCATGEEAYSLAMLLADHQETATGGHTIQIFATDPDERAVAVAREGLYTDGDVADVPVELLQRYFTREGGGYRIARSIREMVLFAHHNVIRDPPFSHLDLISCRNLLIYFNRAVQERVVETFHFALRPGGYLFLGSAESPDTRQDLFSPVNKGAHIYESRTVTSRPVLPPLPSVGSTVSLTVPRTPDARQADRLSAGELHQRLLERYAPPSLVVTDEHNVIHMSESVGKYLQIGGGEPTRELMRMLRPDLRPDVRTALSQAQREQRAVEVKGVTTTLGDGEHRLDIIVRPAWREMEPGRGYLLVMFSARHDLPGDEEPQQFTSLSAPVASQLEDEVARLKLQLRTTVEQYEVQAEEARAASEEQQAMNEELRSAAEELETSKEELQSVNEELTTVNQELKNKIDELAATNNDFLNLISSGDIGTIFVDRQLRVKLSTPAANQLFNLLRSDVGRPLSDITSDLLYSALYDDVRRVIEELVTLDRETQTNDGRWIDVRLRPYRTADDRIDGVVITLQDISERRRAEDRLRQNEERLRLLIDGALEYAIFTLTPEGLIDSWNPGAQRMFGYSASEVIGQHSEVLFTPEDRASNVPRLELQTAYESGRALDERVHLRRDGSRFYCSGTTLRLGASFGFAKIARDMSPQREAAEALRVVRAELDDRVRTRTDALRAEKDASAQAHQQVSGLLRRLVTAQEDERARISRDLHDQLGQQLTALRLTLQRLGERVAGEDIDTVLRLAQQIDQDLDFLSWELRPAVLDDLGLAAALPLFVKEWSAHYRVAAEYRAGTYTAGTLGRDAEVVFYRVAQEALNNIAKHAHASRVDVLLDTREGSVLMVVEDNGVGFDPDDGSVRDTGIGIAGMRERASLVGAYLDIESSPGDGTSLYLRIPLVAPAAPTGV